MARGATTVGGSIPEGHAAPRVASVAAVMAKAGARKGAAAMGVIAADVTTTGIRRGATATAMSARVPWKLSPTPRRLHPVASHALASRRPASSARVKGSVR